MYTIAIVGATGVVGLEAIKLLNERDIDIRDIRLISSERSKGEKYLIKGKEYIVDTLKYNSFDDVDYAILASSSQVSEQCYKFLSESGSKCVLIDNSSAFRMDPRFPLVIPEVNGDYITGQMIANPNCSTIIMLMALYPLHKENRITDINVTTFQAVSGAGKAGLAELEMQAEDYVAGMPIRNTGIFGSQILFNAISHNSDIDMVSLFNGEEIKMVRETHKILHDHDIRINCTCVRIPTKRSHMESITVTFTNPTDVDTLISQLEGAPGIKIVDNPKENKFPEPIISAECGDVMVGRIRQSYHGDSRVFQLLVCGDQILKGAALNAVQIMEYDINKKLQCE